MTDHDDLPSRDDPDVTERQPLARPREEEETAQSGMPIASVRPPRRRRSTPASRIAIGVLAVVVAATAGYLAWTRAATRADRPATREAPLPTPSVAADPAAPRPAEAEGLESPASPKRQLRRRTMPRSGQ